MNSRLKKTLVLPLAICFLGLMMIAGFSPATYATYPTCTGTLSQNGYTYTLTLTPCLPSGQVPLNTGVKATATTTDGTINVVWIRYFQPSSTTVPAASYAIPGSYTFVAGPYKLDVPGTWTVSAYFYTPLYPGSYVSIVTVNESVQILVLNDLPLGTVAAAGVALLGLFTVRRFSKSFATPPPAL